MVSMKTPIPVAAYPGLSVKEGCKWPVREMRKGRRLGDDAADTKMRPL